MLPLAKLYKEAVMLDTPGTDEETTGGDEAAGGDDETAADGETTESGSDETAADD